jgi:hypothetical protein
VASAQESSPPDGSAPTSTAPGDATLSGGGPTDSVLPATTPGTLPLVPVPSSCTAPPQPELVFVGTLVERDFRTGRFEIEQVRAGDDTPFSVGGLVDVRYGIDVEYLEIGTAYLVSARRDPVIGLLASKIREPAPLLGGDDVVGVAESDVECPLLEDPIRVALLFFEHQPVGESGATPSRHADPQSIPVQILLGHEGLHFPCRLLGQCNHRLPPVDTIEFRFSPCRHFSR